MPFVHGRNTVFTFDSVDLSAFISSINYNPTADSHDVTTYGNDAHVYEGGLLDGTLDVSGFYDDGATGPRASLIDKVGTKATYEFQPEGAGAPNAQSTGDALLLGYSESDPVNGIIQWTARFQLSGDQDHTDQV